jgi:hypothetical protein
VWKQQSAQQEATANSQSSWLPVSIAVLKVHFEKETIFQMVNLWSQPNLTLINE